MGIQQQGGWPIDTVPSWTDEALPLDLRRVLLDRALDEVKAARVQGSPARAPVHPARRDRHHPPGEGGSESSGHDD